MDRTLTTREEANAIVCYVFRNGMLEDPHAGKNSELLSDPELSRITNDEMKALMIECCEKMAKVLQMKEHEPEAYEKLIRFYDKTYTKNWMKQ